MALQSRDAVPLPQRRSASHLIDAVVQNMRENLEPLKFSTLVPSRYLVYVHPIEYRRLEGIIPVLQAEAVRALTDELDRLNRRPLLARYRDRLLGEDPPLVRNAANRWIIEFIPDPDDHLKPGDLLVDSELLLPANPELGVGERTRRITTEYSGTRHTTRERRIAHVEPVGAARILARISYDDDAGHHAFEVVKDSVTIGRGGIAYPVDVRIVSSVDVSREHARIRRDSASGQFFLIDLSSLGTSLNGRAVTRGYDEIDGTKRENGVESPLPDRARIGLAGTITLDFQLEPR